MPATAPKSVAIRNLARPRPLHFAMKRQSADPPVAPARPDHQDLLQRCREQAAKLRRLRAAMDRSATECETYHVPARELEKTPG
jgi:hypothetical protein